MKKPLFPLQYENELPIDYVENGIETSAHIDIHDIEDDEVREILETLGKMSLKSALRWLNEKGSSFSSSVEIVEFNQMSSKVLLDRCKGRDIKLIVQKRPLQTFYELNLFFAACNKILEKGGYIWCNSQTSKLQQEVILCSYPVGIDWIVWILHYIWHRMCPKLRLTKKLYFALTKGRNRSFSRVEILGRMYRAGFEVIDEDIRDSQLFVVGHRYKEAITDDTPNVTPIIKLKRVGLDGKTFGVYKFRTMFSYSEYLQEYVYQHNQLRSGGKFANDYRINFWGKLLRACWLDEFPMVINLFKGQMKLVGVRPLSQHYFSLYTPEMQELRTRTKPGLLPPFYYEKVTPVTLEDVQESEKRYLEAYLKAPFKTDWRYFWGIIRNILFGHKQSH